MKLARKLTIALILGIFAVTGVSAYVRVTREIAFFETERRQLERLLGRVLRASVEAVAQSQDETGAQDLVRHADDSVSDVRIRWVWLDGNEDGAEARPAVPVDELSGLRHGRQIVRSQYHEGDEERRYAYIPISAPSGRAAALEISESLQQQRSYLRTSVLHGVVAALVIATVCGIIAIVLGLLFVGRPIRALCEQARRVGAGDLSHRLNVQQRDEIGELGHELNAMCDRLVDANRQVAAEIEAKIAAVEQLRHADRLKTVGQLASGIAHELGTPLNVILGRAKRVRASTHATEELASTLDVITEMAERMTTIIRQLLDFARRRGPRLGARDVVEITRHTLAMLSPIAEKRGVTLRTLERSAPLLAEVDENQLQQALTNLVLNGIQAMDGGGTLTVDVATTRVQAPRDEGADTEHVHITIADQGCGISPDAVPHIFEPFFTTKGAGEGTGLGLPIAYDIVREHGGWITVDSTPGVGTRFDVFLRPARVDAATDRART
ncbi:MAG: HAMP domain-containing histidine kinase [Deltaproteobacteria bacterium]|nr:HAMP domain-containing histidine kinase [Deltaproteobacteria bacterium]